MVRLNPLIPFAAALLAVAAYLTAPVSDPRIFFHLAVGDSIRASGVLPVSDVWTLAGQGKSWVAENWTFEVLLSSLEASLGMRTFGVLGLLATIAFTLSLGRLLLTLAGSETLAVLITVLVACGCLERTELSPELCAWTFLILSVSVCLSTAEASRRILALAAIGVVLANLHSSFLLLPVFVFFLFSGTKNARLTACFVTLASALVSPYHGAQVLQGLVGIWGEAELAVLFQDSAANVFLFSFAFLSLLWMIFVLMAPPQKSFRGQHFLALAGVLSLGGFVHRDLLPYALMTTGMLVAIAIRYWREAADAEHPQLVESFFRLQNVIARVPAAGGLWLFLCLFIINVVPAQKMPLVDLFMPRRAVDFLLEEHINGTIFHDRAIGPYLDYRFFRLAPGVAPKPAYDERLTLFSKDLALAERSLKGLQQGWEKGLEMIHPDIAICRKGSAIFSYLSVSPDWKLGFEDELSMYSGDEIEAPAKQKKKNSGFGWAVFLKVVKAPI